MIITSFLFPDGEFSLARLEQVVKALKGNRNKLVIDLSCRRQGSTWFVAMNKWQTITKMEISKGSRVSNPEQLKSFLLTAKPASIAMLEPYCSEFLIHAADHEGLQKGIDEDLVTKLAQWCSIPVTYAGGARHMSDLDLVNDRSEGRVDLTIGSALDIFGGSTVTYQNCLVWNKQHTV